MKNKNNASHKKTASTYSLAKITGHDETLLNKLTIITTPTTNNQER